MTNVIDSKLNPSFQSTSELAAVQQKSSIFDDGLRAFQEVFNDLNPFAETSLKNSNQAPQYPEAEVTIFAEEISRKVFGGGTFQPTSVVNLSPEDIAMLQQSLIGALKTSLMNSSSDAKQPSIQTDQVTDIQSSQVTDTHEPLVRSSISGFLESAKNIAFGADGFGMKDAFDTVNILNHIPIISDLYKDTAEGGVNAFSSIAGSFLVAGPMGAAFAAADVVTEQFTGDSIFGHLIDWGKETISEGLEAASSNFTPSFFNSPNLNVR